MDLSTKIEVVRTLKRISPTEISEKMGIERPNYYRLEKRGEKMTIEQLKAIALALEVEIYDLLEVDNSELKTDKVKELEFRIEELKAVVKATQSEINSYEFDAYMLLESLGEEIVKHFSAAKSGGSISQLYKLHDKSPYCKLIRNDNTKRLIESYLNFKSRESEFLRSFYMSELFDMDVLFDAMDNINFVSMNKENISTMVSELIERDWDEMAVEQERIDNDPKTQKRIESLRAYREKINKEMDD